jgi:hypothetical protein
MLNELFFFNNVEWYGYELFELFDLLRPFIANPVAFIVLYFG